MAQEVLGRAERLYSTFINPWGEDEPRFLAQNRPGNGHPPLLSISLSTDGSSLNPEAEPTRRKGLIGDKKGIRVEKGDPGSPSSPLLIHLIYVT